MNISQFVNKETAKQNGNGNGHSKLKPLKFRWASDIEPTRINWLWKPFIAYRTFTILEGEEGLGKSFLTLAIAAAQATGWRLPNAEAELEPARVLMLVAEDGAENTIVPRLDALGADKRQVAIIEEPFALDSDGILRLRMLLAEVQPRLVIIDPLFAFTKGNVNNESDTRPIANEIKMLAEEFDCAIIGIRHIGKAKGHGDPRQAGMASIAWRAAARSVLLVGKNPDDPSQKAMCQTKSNLGKIPDYSIGFEICPSSQHETGEFFWTGESNLTAQKMLASSSSDEDAAGINEAVAFLRETLRDGEKTAREVADEGKALGLTERQLRYARQKLRIVPKKNGGFFGKVFGQNWSWSLPEDDNRAEDCRLQQNEQKQTTYRLDSTEDDKSASGTGENCHLQPKRESKSSKNDSLAEDDKGEENCHLQQPGNGKLFPTKSGSTADNDKPPGFETPRPRVCPCLYCHKQIGIDDEICRYCGESQELEF